MKITSGDNPLDATWIHPESYPLAQRVLDKMECTLEDLAESQPAARIVERAAQVELQSLTAQLDAGAGDKVADGPAVRDRRS